MQYEAFRAWLADKNVTPNAINTRSYSVRKIDTSLRALGLEHASLDDAWKAGAFAAVEARLKELQDGVESGDESYRILLPQTQNPVLRLRNFRSWLGQYKRFLNERAGLMRRSDWPELEGMRDAFLDLIPDFESFEQTTGPYFEYERAYKQSIIEAVASASASLADSPEALGRAVVAAMQPRAGPLLRWQTTDWFQGKFEALAPAFFEAIGKLVTSTDPIVAALRQCIDTLRQLQSQGVRKLTRGEILSIALSVAGCARPAECAPFKIVKAQQLSLRLSNQKLFIRDEDTDADIADWLSLLGRVFVTMRDVWDWKPRDLIDVQGFAWVVLDAENREIEDTEMTDTDSLSADEQAERALLEPRNLILYGPPGTGKTFAMSALAVSLCEGRLPTDLNARQDDASIRARYDDLRQRGRIEFVTFHQSFSYEEFVEGLRPDTSANDGVNTVSGFRLTPEDGVFRRICRLAERAKTTKAEPGTHLDRTAVFKASLGPTWDEAYAYLFEECIANGYILLGYGGEVDWSAPAFNTFEAIRAEWNRIDPSANGNDPNVKSVYTLRVAMTEGDLVVVSNGNLRFRAIGRIAGPYQFERREQDQYHHRRRVDWLWVDQAEGLSHSDIYEKRFSMQALYKMVDSSIKWPAIEEIVSGGGTESGPGHTPGYVLIIDEINRANISKVFGELITLLEPDKRLGGRNELRVRLPYSKEDFGVPSNLHILGTMNTADRSIALLDTALRRRFEFVEMMPEPERLSEDVGGLNLRRILETLNDRIEYLFDRDHQIGHAYFMGCDTREAVDRVMRRKIIPLLAEYFHEDWEKVRRVLGETREDGSFIHRRKLKAPGTTESDSDPEQRYRYTVQGTFPEAAYEQLGA